MSQNTTKKLSDVARENNEAKATRYSASMIPPPPVKTLVSEKAVDAAIAVEPDEVEPAPVAPVQTQPEESPVIAEVAPVSKPTRAKRSTNAITVDELIVPQPPKDESYPKQVRISAKHHRLLREVSFKKDVTINHVLYNLLDQLYEANQRDNQQHV